MRIAIGSDLSGYPLKEIICEHLKKKGLEVVDFGVKKNENIDYPEIACAVAERVAAGEFERAILCCGTGIGMAIVANKIPGVRAAVCHDPYSAERARMSNNAQVMSMGALVIDPNFAKMITDIWLSSEFQRGRSLPKVNKIMAIDEKYRRAN